MTALAQLAAAYPWPREPPALPFNSHGWSSAFHDRCFLRFLTPSTRVTLELGSWLGVSTRLQCRLGPNVTVIAVDTWEGSPEHVANPEWQAMLPTLYPQFLANNWALKERIIPLRMTSLEGLRTVQAAGITPELIYIDADHALEAVTADLQLALDLFPETPIMGDDWGWESVRTAAIAVAKQRDLLLESDGIVWWMDRGSR